MLLIIDINSSFILLSNKSVFTIVKRILSLQYKNRNMKHFSSSKFIFFEPYKKHPLTGKLLVIEIYKFNASIS